ncbi:MAG: hypothetical protein VKJ02_19335 [Snowella sp.]|nr:hypothetical protein [Snowella sp.]
MPILFLRTALSRCIRDRGYLAPSSRIERDSKSLGRSLMRV